MIVGIATDCRLWNSIAARAASWNRGVTMSVTGIILDRPYNNTQSDGDDYAMCVSGRLSVTPLHCVVDVRGTPEKYQFIPEGVAIVSRESIMKLARIFHERFCCNRGGGSQNPMRYSLFAPRACNGRSTSQARWRRTWTRWPGVQAGGLPPSRLHTPVSRGDCAISRRTVMNNAG